MTPSEARDYLARSVRSRYEAGHTMGQQWQLDLSEWIEAQSDTDERFVRLAGMAHLPTGTGFFYETDWTPPVDPSMWLQAFVDWADSPESAEYGGRQADGGGP